VEDGWYDAETGEYHAYDFAHDMATQEAAGPATDAAEVAADAEEAFTYEDESYLDEMAAESASEPSVAAEETEAVAADDVSECEESGSWDCGDVPEEAYSFDEWESAGETAEMPVTEEAAETTENAVAEESQPEEYRYEYGYDYSEYKYRYGYGYGDAYGTSEAATDSESNDETMAPAEAVVESPTESNAEDASRYEYWKYEDYYSGEEYRSMESPSTDVEQDAEMAPEEDVAQSPESNASDGGTYNDPYDCEYGYEYGAPMPAADEVEVVEGEDCDEDYVADEPATEPTPDVSREVVLTFARTLDRLGTALQSISRQLTEMAEVAELPASDDELIER
jgi:hypothetical protein